MSLKKEIIYPLHKKLSGCYSFKTADLSFVNEFPVLMNISRVNFIN